MFRTLGFIFRKPGVRTGLV